MANMKGAPNRRYKLSGEEALLFLVATAPTLGSLKSDDPYLVIPMLAISGISFVLLCARHQGSALLRILSAIAMLSVLLFVGWRDLRKPVTALPQAPKMNVHQKADDTNCSNIAAGGNVTVDCTTEDKKHDKP